MKKVFVYCHGYGSSAKTEKVDRMRAAGLEVLACNINIDPNIGISDVCNMVDDYLLKNMNAEIELVFVGTSLGGWYASKLAKIYGAKSLLINPAFNPSRLLPTIGVSRDVADKYSDFGVMNVNDDTYLFIATQDEVIDFSDMEFDKLTKNVSSCRFFRFMDETHRFNGPGFDFAISVMKDHM